MNVAEFSLPLTEPLETARGEVTEREGFLVALDPDADDVAAGGIGEATPLPGWTESHGTCRRALAGIAGDPTDTDDREPVGENEAPAARHAVSLARADATARTEDVPLATYLAADVEFPGANGHAETVPVNATVGDASAADTAAEAGAAVESGYRAVKVKVGARALEADGERIAAVREAVGPDVEIRADANGAWCMETARDAVEKLAEVDVAYVEQPLPAEDLAGHAELRAESPVDVALDESLAHVDVETVLDAEAADVLVLKPMALGGPDRALAAARAAREAGIEPVVTTTVDAVVARTAAVHVAAAIPDIGACGLATGSLLASDLAPDPAPVEGGHVAVPDGPGIAGDAFDELVEK